MYGVAICAGVGGLELGLELVLPDYRTVVYVEREAYAAAILVARMAEGALAPAAVWDDVDTFDGRRWRGCVSIVSAGFPCQPWSAAGKGAGVEDERWIWPSIAQRIGEIRPDFVFLENVPPIVLRGGLATVLGSLAELGFHAEWDLFRAADVGASHRRERVYVLAYRDGCRLPLVRAPHDEHRRHAPGHDADRRRATVADAGRRGRWDAVWTPAESGRQGRARAERRRNELADADGARLQRLRGNGADGDRQGRVDAITRGPARARGAALGDADSAERLVGDATDGGRRELRESSGRERLAGRTDETVADADGGTLRLESERDQRDRRRARTPEREHAELGSDVPLFPPAPGDLDNWRRVLAIRPDLAPAIRRDVLVHAARGVPRTEPEELRAALAGRQVEQTGVGGSDDDVRNADFCEHYSVCRNPNACDGQLAHCWLKGQAQSAVRLLADGTSARVDQLRACGNSVVPLAVAYAFTTLAARAGILDVRESTPLDPGATGRSGRSVGSLPAPAAACSESPSPVRRVRHGSTR